MNEFNEPIEMSGKSGEETRPIHRESGMFDVMSVYVFCCLNNDQDRQMVCCELASVHRIHNITC